jgi:hypothetical protein
MLEQLLFQVYYMKPRCRGDSIRVVSSCLIDNSCFMRTNCMGEHQCIWDWTVRPLIDNASVMWGTSLITIRNNIDDLLAISVEP